MMKLRRILTVVGVLMIAFSANLLAGGATEELAVEGNEFEGVTLKAFLVAVDEDLETTLHSLEDELGFGLEILTSSWDQWAQKVNIMVATGVDVDLISCEESLPWREWAQDGLVKNLDNYIDPVKHGYIDSLTSAGLYGGFKEGGNRYFMPNAHQGSDWSILVREDIMNALGIDEIDDMDEYYEAMVRAKNDFGVYGLALSLEDGLMKLQSAAHIFAAFGGGGFIPQSRSFYIDEKGVVTDKSISSGTKEALIYTNKLYRNDLINKDYATIRNGLGTTYLEPGKTFSMFSPAISANGFNTKMASINPEWKYALHAAIGAETPEFYPITNGFNMWQVSFIPESSKNPEAALAFFEYMNSREGRERIVAGIPGVTYTEAGFSTDGVYEKIPAGLNEIYGSETTSLRWYGLGSTVFGYIPTEKYSSYEEAYANKLIFMEKSDVELGNPLNVRNIIKMSAPYSGYNEVSEVPLPIESEVRSNLNNVKGEYWNKIIMAEDPSDIDDLWDRYVAEWKSVGGDDYVAAYQEFYNTIR
jgi:putative aldouronate transport system substrate-binding protein